MMTFVSVLIRRPQRTIDVQPTIEEEPENYVESKDRTSSTSLQVRQSSIIEQQSSISPLPSISEIPRGTVTSPDIGDIPEGPTSPIISEPGSVSDQADADGVRNGLSGVPKLDLGTMNPQSFFSNEIISFQPTVEAQLFELQEKLIESGLSDEEIAEKVEEERVKLTPVASMAPLTANYLAVERPIVGDVRAGLPERIKTSRSRSGNDTGRLSLSDDMDRLVNERSARTGRSDTSRSGFSSFRSYDTRSSYSSRSSRSYSDYSNRSDISYSSRSSYSDFDGRVEVKVNDSPLSTARTEDIIQPDDDEILREFSYNFTEKLIGNVLQGIVLNIVESKLTEKPVMRRRQGLVMQAISSGEDAVMKNVTLDLDKSRIVPEDIITDAPKYLKNPKNALVKVLEIGEFYVDIPDDVFPSRAYVIIRVKKWNLYTLPLHRGKLSMTQSTADYRSLVWRDVDKNAPPDIEWPDLRIYQDIFFEFWDGASSLQFGKGRLNYLDFAKCDPEMAGGELTVPCMLTIEKAYGGGTVMGTIRIHVYYHEKLFVRPVHQDSYWARKRPQHWRTFPLTPISAGQVRSKFRTVSKQYDRQMIINPVFYGFIVRWRGHNNTEDNFINPIFKGYQLPKKGLTKEQLEKIMLEQQKRKDSTNNPYKWDETAAGRGQCPICANGKPGCPRCFMLPKQKNGDSTVPEDYAYNPEREKRIALAIELKTEKEKVLERRKNEKLAQRKEMKRLEKLRKKKLQEDTRGFAIDEESSSSSESDDAYNVDDDSSVGLEDILDRDIEELPTIHTKLTTFDGIKRARATMIFFTIYIKVLPGGYLRKFVCSDIDSMFYVHQMFNVHSHLGNSISPKFLLPSEVGIFEMESDMDIATDLLISIKTGEDTFAKYGVRENKSTLVLIYVAKYHPENISPLITTYCARNTNFAVSSLNVYDNVRNKLPPSWSQDRLQSNLLDLCTRQYTDQEETRKKYFIDAGIAYMRSKDADQAANARKKREDFQKAEQEAKAKERRIESQLKGLSGEEREAALRSVIF
jgi:hypothetical protein